MSIAMINKKTLLKTIAKRLRKLRKDHNYTQEYVAYKIGIHLVTYQNYETSNPYEMKIYNLYKIADLYSVSLDDLIS